MQNYRSQRHSGLVRNWKRYSQVYEDSSDSDKENQVRTRQLTGENFYCGRHKVLAVEKKIQEVMRFPQKKKTDFDLKQRKQKLFSQLLKYKASKLKTANTIKKKEGYLQKLSVMISKQDLKAVRYQFDAQCIKYVNQYLAMSSITTICLDGNPLGDSGVIKLTEIFGKTPLKELSLVSVSMNNKGAFVLLQSLQKVTTIKKINLSTNQSTLRNKITSEGIMPLKKILGNSIYTLDTLILDHICLGNEGIKSAFHEVICESLQHLSLSQNQLGFSIFQNFSTFLNQSSIIKLDLSKNNIGDYGIKKLTQILGLNFQKNKISINLTYLNISCNNITARGFQYFCSQMGFNQKLQTLILDSNCLADGQRFFNVKYYLNKNWGLKKLSLINTSLSQKDIKYICQGLQINRSLQSLILTKNQMNSDIFCSILMMLSKNKCLRSINLSNCKILQNYIVKNESIIDNNKFSGIEEIDLENNYLNSKGAAILKKMILKNTNILKLNVAKCCAPQLIVQEMSQILKDHQVKRPFQRQLNHFNSISESYQQKKNILLLQIQKIKDYQQRLQISKLIQQIQLDQIRQCNLLKEIQIEYDQINKLNQLTKSSIGFMTSPRCN